MYYEWVKTKQQSTLSDIAWRGSSFVKFPDRVCHPDFEEIRTILGFYAHLHLYEAHYLEGDDISENAFLLSNGKPLRFGHKNLQFIEYGPSVTIATECVHIAVEAYTGKTLNIPKLPSISPNSNIMIDFSEEGEFGTRYCPVKRE